MTMKRYYGVWLESVSEMRKVGVWRMSGMLVCDDDVLRRHMIGKGDRNLKCRRVTDERYSIV